MGAGVSDPYEKYRQMNQILELVEEHIMAEFKKERDPRWFVRVNNPWDFVRVGDTWEVPEVGTVTCVEETTDTTREGDFSYWSQPIWIILQAGDRYFQIIGKNKSHEGSDYDYPAFREVTPSQKTITVWGEVRYDSDGD